MIRGCVTEHDECLSNRARNDWKGDEAVKIQLLSYRTGFEKYSVAHYNLETPHTFDSFDVNIIDLNDKNVFMNKNHGMQSIDKRIEIQQIKGIIEGKVRSTTIIMLPQNLEYHYSWGYNSGRGTVCYNKSCFLSTMLGELEEILQTTIIPKGVQFKLCYEISKTKCGKTELKADFYFDEKSTQCAHNYDFVTRANYSKKPTTIHFDNIYITTLDILETPETLTNYMDFLNVSDSENEEEPEWIKEIVFDDDKEQAEEITKQKDAITKAEEIIENANNKLKENNRYKSILYANGEQLVEVVFDILENIFLYDMSEFHDVKKEDFLIRLDNVTFIGEIKGITSNVKSEHVSQLEVHFQGYQDNLREIGCTENVKALLIINPFRHKRPTEREPINEIQEKLAKRNDSLIITTDSLLKLYDMFIKGEIDRDTIKNEFMIQTGILSGLVASETNNF